MKFSRAKYSDCRKCPLKDHNRVWGEGPDEGVIYVSLIGEAPGKDEDAQKRPFVGGAGKILNKGLYEARLNRKSLWITNVISCRPPENDIYSDEAVEAIKCCKKGLEAELNWLKRERKVKVFMPMGKTALKAFDLGDKIQAVRGSVYEQGLGFILPTLHPAFIMRGNMKFESAWISDFEKAKDISRRSWKAPKENFNLYPKIKDLNDLLKMCKSKKLTLGSDIETTALKPDWGAIVVLGFAWSESDALSVPFLSHGGIPYWNDKDYFKMVDIVSEILKTAPMIYQNAFFDVMFQCYHGFPMPHIAFDTMVAMSQVNPELRKRLGDIVSIYGSTTYWKEEFQGRSGTILEMDDETLRTYNLRDCVVLKQVEPGLRSDMKYYGLTDNFENITMPLSPYLIKMTMNGIKVSPVRLAKFKKELIEKIDSAKVELRKLVNVPEGIDFTDDDLRFILFGSVPKKIKDALALYPLYQKKDSKLKKNTKKYEKIELYYRFHEESVKFLSVRKPGKTGSGKVSVDEESRTKLTISANNRLRALREIKRNPKSRQPDIKNIELLLKVIGIINDIAKDKKLESTYTKYPIWKDGLIHPVFDSSGTSTGRLASRDPNAQNIPPEAKKVFIPQVKGNIFIEPDYKNLELRVISFIADDIPLQKDFAAGKDAHDVNTITLFGIDKENPEWKAKRKIVKSYRFGMNYGSTLKGAYSKIMTEFPDCGLTFADFKAIDDKYNLLHPAYFEWREWIIATVLKEKRLINAFGRHRIFHGYPDEIIREGLNFPIQSTAADVVNTTFPILWDNLEAKVPGAKIESQTHDSFLIECSPLKADKVMSICHESLEIPFTIKSRNKTYKDVVFPIDFKMGKDWGHMEEVEC